MGQFSKNTLHLYIKLIIKKDLLFSTGNSVRYVTAWVGKELGGARNGPLFVPPLTSCHGYCRHREDWFLRLGGWKKAKGPRDTPGR